MPAAPRSPEYTGVLDLPIGVKQAGADHANLGPLDMFEQRVKPARLYYFCVIV
jgi:hypothetical protein